MHKHFKIVCYLLTNTLLILGICSCTSQHEQTSMISTVVETETLSTSTPTREFTPVPSPDPTSTPTKAPVKPTKTPSPTATLTPTATNIPLSAKIDYPLPDALLNFAGSAYPLQSCRKASALGEIWLAQYPYTSGTALLSAEDKGFYAPSWSPDNQWVAYVLADNEVIREEEQNNGSWQHFEDSVWIMRADGSESQQLGSSFVHSEFRSTENNTCSATSGIISNLGWSPDGKWLAFIAMIFEPSEGSKPILYLVDTTTGNTKKLVDNIGSFSWSENGNIAIVVYNARSTIQLISLDQLDASPQTISPSTDLPRNYSLGQVQWHHHNDELIVVVKDTTSYNAPTSLWVVDIDSGTWRKVSSSIFEGGSAVKFIVGSDFGLSCFRRDGQIVINIINSLSGNIIGEVETIDGVVDCSTMKLLKDNVGNPTLSILSILEDKQVWVSNVYTGKLKSDSFVNTEDFGTLNSLDVVDVAWRYP